MLFGHIYDSRSKQGKEMVHLNLRQLYQLFVKRKLEFMASLRGVSFQCLLPFFFVRNCILSLYYRSIWLVLIKSRDYHMQKGMYNREEQIDFLLFLCRHIRDTYRNSLWKPRLSVPKLKVVHTFVAIARSYRLSFFSWVQCFPYTP